MSKTQMYLEKNKKYLNPLISQFYEEPVVFEKGEGKYVTDVDGNEYLDFFGGVLTVSIGHCDTEITDKIVDQMRKLQHSSTSYLNVPMIEFAEKLARITPGDLEVSFFLNSGSEADETAVILAILATGSREVIGLRYQYSGRTMLTMNLTAQSPALRLGGTHVPGIRHAHNAYCYRCPFGKSYPNCNLECAKDLEELIRTSTCGQIACLIAEPIQGAGGFITPPKEYFKEAVAIIRKYGGLFISDEVQSGWGRTGGKMWGIEHYDVEPDMLTFAKGAGNGLPVAGTIVTRAVADKIKGASVSTFGGNPICMTAAMATVEAIESRNLVKHCEVVGNYFFERLYELQEKYPCIGDVRGKGLMIGVEIVGENKVPDSATLLRVMEEAKKRKLLIGKGGLNGNIFRIAPPMTVDKSDIDTAIKILDESFAVATK